jgi:hypothetical protein
VVAEGAFQRVQVAAALLQRTPCSRLPFEAGAAGGMCPSSTISALAGTCSISAPRRRAVDHLGAAAAQQAGELVLRQRVGHRRHRAQDGGRVGAQRHGDRERLARVGAREVAEVERAAAMGQPAHDDLARPITCWR